MEIRARLLLLAVSAIGVSFVAVPVSANTATLRCNSQHDQIWVYDSLSTFDVEAKLKCGEDVEIIGRVTDYVKIRAQNGVEGYVPEAAFADLPPVEIRSDPTHDVGLVAKQAQAKEIAKAATNAAFPAPADSSHPKSVAAIPAKSTSEKELASDGSVAPFTAFGEINPSPASPTVKETSPRDVAQTPSTQPTIANPSSSLGISVADATAATIINRPASVALPTRDSAEIADLQPGNESTGPACRKYFSAYGLTPSQMKWMAQNRKRLFPNICPAPDPSKVDFVIIFTHDVDFFGTTMPQPVHKISGFSDFTPMTPIDTALVSESEADKAHREYVWIFQFAKGTFDPASFSPHAQYQFSKMETSSLGSKGSLKTVADAFQFVAAASR
jgi:hypothetical protein